MAISKVNSGNDGCVDSGLDRGCGASALPENADQPAATADTTGLAMAMKVLQWAILMKDAPGLPSDACPQSTQSFFSVPDPSKRDILATEIDGTPPPQPQISG